MKKDLLSWLVFRSYSNLSQFNKSIGIQLPLNIWPLILTCNVFLDRFENMYLERRVQEHVNIYNEIFAEDNKRLNNGLINFAKGSVKDV